MADGRNSRFEELQEETVDEKLAKDLLNKNKEYAKERFEYYKNLKIK